MLSVIIPVYNVEKYIRECLESVVRQKTDDLEIIIVNDGSTDQSEKICKEYMKLYPDIVYKKQKNAGLGAARNAGLMCAKGEYVIFLDSDDSWEKNLLDCVSACIHENSYLDILYFDSEVFYEDEETIRNDSYDARMYHRENSVKDRIYKGAEFFLHTYPLHFNVQACMAVFRKDFLREHHIVFPEGVFYEDHLFSMKAVLKAETVKYLPQRLYRRRYHANSITTSPVDEKHMKDYMQVIRLMNDFVCSRATLNDIRHKELPYESLLFRKMNDKVFSLVQTFFEMCSLYVGDLDVIRPFKEEIYKNVFDTGIKKGMEKLHLEELEAVLYLCLKSEEDRKADLTGKERIPEEFFPRQFFYDCKHAYQKKAKIKLKRLGIFEQNKKTGIYGGGNHTKGLLQAAEQFGEPPAELFLLDSYAESGEHKFAGLPVVNIRDIPADTDQIIISSFLYERELYENAEKYAKEHMKINRLYQDEVRELCWQFIYK